MTIILCIEREIRSELRGSQPRRCYYTARRRRCNEKAAAASSLHYVALGTPITMRKEDVRWQVSF